MDGADCLPLGDEAGLSPYAIKHGSVFGPKTENIVLILANFRTYSIIID